MGQYEGGGITNGQQLLKSFPYGMTVALDFQAFWVGLVRRLLQPSAFPVHSTAFLQTDEQKWLQQLQQSDILFDPAQKFKNLYYRDIWQRSQPNVKIQIFDQNEKSQSGRLEFVKEID